MRPEEEPLARELEEFAQALKPVQKRKLYGLANSFLMKGFFNSNIPEYRARGDQSNWRQYLVEKMREIEG